MDDSVRRSMMLDLISRLETAEHRVTMTSLQKLPYFLQEATNVPLGFRFVMHYYGPYSFDLAQSIQAMAATGTIRVLHDAMGYGYWVHSADTDDAREILAETREERARYAEALDEVVESLGSVQPWELELLSTCHFVRELLRRNNRADNDETVAREVHSLKPKFTEQQISAKISELDKILATLQSPTSDP